MNRSSIERCRKAIVVMLFVVPVNVLAFSSEGRESIQSIAAIIMKESLESVGILRGPPPDVPPPGRGCSRNPHQGGCPVSPVR